MPRVVFGSLESLAWQLTLDEPFDVIEAWRIDEVLPLLAFAEARAKAGAYVAVMISYEAAPAFDEALAVHEPSFPLAWVALFNEPTKVCKEATGSFATGSWTAGISKNDYELAVLRIRELIAAGDTYQVNYSFPLTASFSGDAYAWYSELCAAQRAPYSTYLDLGRYRVLSLSPELFFERRGARVITRPMKGTARRGRWLAEDEELKQRLHQSSKDRAENIMIVDLLRNDLGKVSVLGSVQASSLFKAERYETVWQLTSTVESTLRMGTRLVDLMSALFPCGSVTGAPKIRTTQIIRELEPFPRGPYTGAIGLLRPGGDCVFNVAIRTIVIDTQTGLATFGVGGGVTIDSTAAGEYEECLVKSRFLQTKPAEFELFESMLLEDGKIFLLERHIERLKNSAAYFGFRFEFPTGLEAVSGTWKVKVRLNRNGSSTVERSPLTNLPDPMRVSLANTPIDSTDRFLFHKTTKRDFYVSCDDVILWNERGEVTESSIANIVVPIDGELYTPPLSCGLLPGTFREQLLAEGKIRERVITVEELKQAKQFFLINSVRKWMKAICVHPCSSVAQL